MKKVNMNLYTARVLWNFAKLYLIPEDNKENTKDPNLPAWLMVQCFAKNSAGSLTPRSQAPQRKGKSMGAIYA